MKDLKKGKVTNKTLIWRDFFKNDYLSFDDLVADKTVTIKSIDYKDVTGPGGKVKPELVATFKEDILPMIISKGKSREISRLHKTKHVAEWVGKKITLFPDPTRKYHGEEVGGVGIRPIVTNQDKKALDQGQFDRMIAAINSKALSYETAIKNYALTTAQMTKLNTLKKGVNG